MREKSFGRAKVVLSSTSLGPEAECKLQSEPQGPDLLRGKLLSAPELFSGAGRAACEGSCESSTF